MPLTDLGIRQAKHRDKKYKLAAGEVNRPGFSGHLQAVHYGNHGGGHGQQAALE